MKEKLEKLIENAYSPYYNFKVAVILVTKDNKEFKGVNVENSNGTSICAERNAISSAVASGYKKGDFKQLFIMFQNKQLGFPCFACRQVLLEFFDKNTIITCITDSGDESHTLEELCPYPFNGDDLK